MKSIYFQDRQMIVADDLMEKMLALALKASKTTASVLICGESGTGKELIARFIHEKGPRSAGPFVSINCAAIPEGLIEAELFGYEKGAFTGAISQRIGRFERANGGTLLLDEVSEMPIGPQAKLLRVLQEGEIDRLGGREIISIDSRIIATTNQDPRKLIEEGSFREDLFYRLNVIRIEVASLRGRPVAIVRLAQEFLKQSCINQEKENIFYKDETIEKLVAYDWPGNIREMQNSVERAVLLTETNYLAPEHFDFLDIRKKKREENIDNLSLAELEEIHIERILNKTKGNRTEAAKLLGITSRTLRNKLKEFAVG